MSRAVLDLFAGAAGGWSLGMSRAGYHTVVACELDPWRNAVFAANHPKCRMYADVRELSASRLVSDLGCLPDIIVGSPPCQDASAANTKGRGIAGARTGLFFEAARLVNEIRPLWCAFENSPRMRTRGIDRITHEMEEAGYSCWLLVVGAMHVGANHERKRVWLIAADTDRAHGWQQALSNGTAAHHRHDPVDANHRDAENNRGLEEREVYDWTCSRTGTVNLSDAPNPHCPRHPLRPRERSDDGEELPPALRAIGSAWPDWNNGLPGLAEACAAAGFGAVDDGPNAHLPAGVRNRAIAALGDAVLPQISEAIGRAMMGLTA